MGFLGPLNAMSIRGTSRRKLVSPLEFAAATWIVRVPAEFESDGASVPWPFRMLIPRDGRYRDAAWVHDFLYSPAGKYYRVIDGSVVTDYTRQTANAMMGEIMQDPALNVRRWRRWAILLGLKIGSRFVWDR